MKDIDTLVSRYGQTHFTEIVSDETLNEQVSS